MPTQSLPEAYKVDTLDSLPTKYYINLFKYKLMLINQTS